MWLPRGGRDWGRTLPSHGYQWEEASSGTPLILSWRQRRKWLALFPEDSRRGGAYEMVSGSPLWNLNGIALDIAILFGFVGVVGGGRTGDETRASSMINNTYSTIEYNTSALVLLVNVCPLPMKCCQSPGWAEARLGCVLFFPPWSCLCSFFHWLAGLGSCIRPSAHFSVHLFF